MDETLEFGRSEPPARKPGRRRPARPTARRRATLAGTALVFGAAVFGTVGCSGDGNAGKTSGSGAPAAEAGGGPAAQQAPGTPAQPAVSEAWIRLLPGTSPSGGYFVIRNDSDAARTLVGADAADFQSVQLHRSVEQNGLATMVHVDKVVVPAHGEVKFEPGGYHLMLMGRQHPLTPGNTEKVTLHFADGTQLPVEFQLRNATGTVGK